MQEFLRRFSRADSRRAFSYAAPGSAESDSHADYSACEVSDYDSEYERKDGCELFFQERLSTDRLADFSERSAILTSL